LGEYFEYYVTLKTPKWSDASRESVTSIFKRHVIPVIGDETITACTRADLQALLNSLSKAGLSYSLLHKVRTYLKAMFDEALENDLIEKNPARKLEFRSAERPSKRYLSQEEVQRILAATDGRDYLILRICLVGGLRPGELFALR